MVSEDTMATIATGITPESDDLQGHILFHSSDQWPRTNWNELTDILRTSPYDHQAPNN